MKRNKNVQDERIVSESNRIYKICFYVLCGGLFADLIVKFNLYGFSETGKETLITFGLETFFLVVVFYLNLFLLARKGISFGAADLETEKFPVKRYLLISGIISGVLSIGLWTIRFCTGSWEYGLMNAILFCGGIYLLTFSIAFGILLLSFYIAFKVAKKNFS